MIRVSVGVLVCRVRGVLLLRTAKDGLLYGAGMWECPGGKPDARDLGPTETLMREIQEEIGLNISEFTIGKGIYPIGMVAANDLDFRFYAIFVPSDWQPVLSEEHDGWCWYRPDTGYVTEDKGDTSWDFHDRLAPPDLSFIWAGWRLLGGGK